MTDTRKGIRDQLFVKDIIHYGQVVVSLREAICLAKASPDVER
jgi:hypothetical protein